MLDLKNLTYQQMADVVRAVGIELKRRNPIGVNFYTSGLIQAVADLEEIHAAEKSNLTSEAGPGVDHPTPMPPLWPDRTLGQGIKAVTFKHRDGSTFTQKLYCPTDDVTPKVGQKWKHGRKSYIVVEIATCAIN